MQEGSYDIEVTVKDGYQATETTSAVVTYEVASRVAGSEAVITPTLNPLVALYSVPPSSPCRPPTIKETLRALTHDGRPDTPHLPCV